MKKIVVTLSFVVVLSLMFIVGACVEEQKEPYHSISDAKGLRIDLEWTTGSNEATSLKETDLDLDVFNSDGEILSSYNTDEFEQVDFANDFEDGVYIVKISVHEISDQSDFTLKVSGALSGRTHRKSGVLLVSQIQQTLPVLEIVKKGRNFTLLGV